VAWDLDGDGQFDDAGGDAITARFARPDPAHEVAARVSDGQTATVVRARLAVVRSPVIHLPLVLRLTDLR
jgi:hypothetical protein